MANLKQNQNVPFDYGVGPNTVEIKPSMIYAVGMLFDPSPRPQHPEKALAKMLDALRQAHFSNRKWFSDGAPGLLSEKALEDGGAERCYVRARTSIDNILITSLYLDDIGINTLLLELPHPQLWKYAGLAWLGKNQNCCELNRMNFTPWLGRSCRCADDQ